ncbi:MAG: ABC transporter substrate-binding protein [Rickettsiaceae bacterium]
MLDKLCNTRTIINMFRGLMVNFFPTILLFRYLSTKLAARFFSKKQLHKYKFGVSFSKMISYVQSLILAVIFFASVAQANNDSDKKIFKVYVNQLVEHPALDATTKGVIDGLSEAGYQQDKNLDLQVEIAQGNMALASQISARFASKKPDIVVGVATLSAQSLAKYAKKEETRLVFTTVTDPLKAGLVETLVNPGNNITGVSNYIELEPQIELFMKIKPSIKKLGFLYNPGELNSLSILEQLKIVCSKYGIKVIGITANKTSEVPQSATRLSSEVDAIFISNDNTALSAIKSIIKAANGQQIPVFVSDTDIVEDGAIAALGPNQYELGKQTGFLIARILNGEDIKKISVEFPKKTELFLNQKAASQLNIVLPTELISIADKVFHSDSP